MTARPNVAELSREESRVPGRAAEHEAAVAAAPPTPSAGATYQGASPAFDPAGLRAGNFRMTEGAIR